MTENYIVHLKQERVEDETLWVAWHPRLSACRAQGATPQEAQEALDDCRRSYLQALADCGQPAPLGDTTIKGRVIVYVHEHVVR